MSDWSLSELLASLHEDIERRLEVIRRSISHPSSKGDESEAVWLELLSKYLPERYEAAKAFVVDSLGQFSEQIDVVVFDRQYTPFIFKLGEQTIIPAEGVYAAFEAKQTIDAGLIGYAQDKVASVRRLHRTSLPIPHAGGTYPAKPPIPILGGVLAFESEWKPALGKPLETALLKQSGDRQMNIGCVAAHGHFYFDQANATYTFATEGKPATAFLFKLISMLQFSGTVPMIDLDAYARWLTA